MEPQRNRRADRHRQGAPNPSRAQPHTGSQDSEPQSAPQADEARSQPAAPLGQALSDLGKSGGQLMSSLLASGSAAMGKLSEKIQDGSLAENFKRNDVLKQGLLFGLPVLLCLLGSGFGQFWMLLGLAAACFYLWRYQLGHDRGTRLDYLLLVFPLVHYLTNNLPLFSQLTQQVSRVISRGRLTDFYAGAYSGVLGPFAAYTLCILLFAWMRARTKALMKALRIGSLIAMGLTLVAGIIQYSAFGYYFGIRFFLYPTLTYLAFFALILYFCKSREKENDFTRYQLQPGERWKPEMAVLAMYLGVFGLHRSRLGYPLSARVIRWGIISVILGSIILALLTATMSRGAMQFGLVLFAISLIYFSVAVLWSLVDLIRILLGHLKPAGGDYAPTELGRYQARQAAQ